MILKFAATIYNGVMSLPQGMMVTLKYFLKRPVTMQYPDQKWVMPARYRGVVSLIFDKNTGKHRCIACKNCVKICPNYSLAIETAVGEDKKWFPKTFTLELGQCMFCGLCVEICPTKALEMNKEYELATYTREELTRSLLP